MKNNLSNKAVWAFSLFVFIWHLVVADGFAQEIKKEEAPFINLGNIAFSPDYTLSDDSTFITFRIRNNSARPITNIFAWIYRSKGDENDKTSSLALVNNPNKGGALVKGGFHRPGEIAEWRFPLSGAKINALEKKYTLRVSPKSIFFGDKTFQNREPN